MAETTPPRRRWYRYGLKALFLLLTLVCVWLGVQAKWVRDRHEALKTIKGEPAPDVVAPWSIRLVEQGVARITVTTTMVHEDGKIDELRRLFPEARVWKIVEKEPERRANTDAPTKP